MGRINVNLLQAKTGQKMLTEQQKINNKKKSQKKYYEKNKKKIIEKQKIYMKNFKDKKNMWARDWYQKNKDLVQARRKIKLQNLTEADRIVQRKKQAIYRAKNKDKISQYRKNFYWKNREKVRDSQKKYYNKNHQKDRQKTCKVDHVKKNINKEDKIKINKKDYDLISYYIKNVWGSN